MKRRRGVVVVLAVAAGIVVLATSIYHFRPLIETSEFSVDASGGLEGVAYRMLGRETLFVELRNDAKGVERWFTADLGSKEVSSPNQPRRLPYLHFNHDMNLGISITDPKYGEGWQIRGDGSSLSFSHPDGLSVGLRKTRG